MEKKCEQGFLGEDKAERNIQPCSKAYLSETPNLLTLPNHTKEREKEAGGAGIEGKEGYIE